MRVSDLINKLQELSEKHGDIEVMTMDSGWSCSIENVEYVDNPPDVISMYDFDDVIINSIILS